MSSLENQDFRKFIDESKAAAVQKKQKPKKKKDRAALHKKPDEEDPDAPKYRCGYHQVREKYTILDCYMTFVSDALVLGRSVLVLVEPARQ
jgi:hypothetical protein